MIAIESEGITGGVRVGYELLLDAAWRGAALLLLAGLAVRCWRGASAARRHLVWGIALAGLLVLPLFSLSVPRWNVTLPERLTGAASLTTPLAFADAPLPAAAPLLDAPLRAGAPELPGRPLPWRESVLVLWLAGTLSLLGVLLLALTRAVSLTRSARSFPAGRCTDAARSLSAAMGMRRTPVLLDAGESAMPMTWGVFRPVVLLPRDAEEWPEEKLRAVLVHELAHLRRRDVLTQLASRVACAFFWYNPLVWSAFRALREESERACDDVVLETGIRPTAYADHLLDFARSARSAPGLAFASSALTDGSPLRSRIHALLAERRDRRRVSRGVLVATLAAGTTLSVALAAATPAPPVAPEGAPTLSPRPIAAAGAASGSPARQEVSARVGAAPSLSPADAPAGAGGPAGVAGAGTAADGATPAPADETTAVRLPREVGAAISTPRAAPRSPRLVLATARTGSARAPAPDPAAVRYTIVPRGIARNARTSSSDVEGPPGCEYVRVANVRFSEARHSARVAEEHDADRLIEVRRVFPDWNSRHPMTGVPNAPYYSGVAIRFLEPSSRVNPKCLEG